MKVLNFGSLNYDYVYHVDHAAAPGETISSSSMDIFCGGKGLNQSVALKKAGACVWQAGLIGEDGEQLLNTLREQGVDVSLVRKREGKSGHAIIQLDKNAQNCILLYGGANRKIDREYIDFVFSGFEEGDLLLLQNEINLLDEIITAAYEKKMIILFNPSPMDASVLQCDLTKISYFLLNEIEGSQITGETNPDAILRSLLKKYPKAKTVLTLGMDGAVYSDGELTVRQPVYPVQAVDTTAAGDTFTGYFVAGLLEKREIPDILNRCALASSITVSRMGAAPSIPDRGELEKRMKQ